MEKRWLHWDPTPVKHAVLSASGLLALADLSTVAHRTTLTGTSSWLDTLVLVPGLHHQQSADTLGKNLNMHPGAVLPPLEAHSSTGGQSRTSTVTNAATARYLRHVGSYSHRGKPVVLSINSSESFSNSSSIADFGKSGSLLSNSDLSKRSTILYLLAANLTVVSLILMILTRDWWGLGMLLALMLSRILNIYIIRARVSEHPSEPKTPNAQETWAIPLSDDRFVLLHGLGHDLTALTTGQWMRAKTTIEGYLEAAAKLIVYLVAAFSGNQHQTGDIILMVLLLLSAGLLALSNARQSSFNMNGRVANVVPEIAPLSRRSTTSAPAILMGRVKGGDVENGKEKTTATSGDHPLLVSHTM